MSGLKSTGNEDNERLVELGMPTLEERRHQADIAMFHKITNRKGGLDPSQWFDIAADGVRATPSTANPHNLRMRLDHMEIRRNFFSVRVVENWI